MSDNIQEIPGFIEFKLPETQTFGRAFVYNDGDTNQLCFYCDGFERLYPLEVYEGTFVSYPVAEAVEEFGRMATEWQDGDDYEQVRSEHAMEICAALTNLPPFLEGQMQLWPSCGGIDDEGALRLSVEDLTRSGLLNGSVT